MARLTTVVLLFFVMPGLLPAQLMTRLLPETNQAFDDYIKGAEAKLEWQAHVAIDKPGVTLVPGATPPTVEVKGAIIHDWRAAILAPGAPSDAVMNKLLAVLQSYDDYPRLYAPRITRSKIYSHEGNLWRVFLQLYKKKLFTANLATEYEIEYRPLGPGRWAILSHSTKVAEVDRGRELPVGQDHGFLWRLNAYWLLEQRPEGVYIECRAISMSRDVPTGLGWAMKPMVTSVPRESLRDTLEDTVQALR